MVELNNKVNMK